MGKILAISNSKGGVGKTSNAANLAGFLAKKGHKTLLIDLDQNDHLKIVTGVRQNVVRGNDIANLIIERLSPDKVMVPVRNNLDLIPSGGKRLQSFEKNFSKIKNAESILKELMTGIKEDYEFTIIDSSPTLSLLHANIACFADYFIIPCDMDMLSIIQTRGFIHSVEVFKEKIDDFTSEILGILPVKYDSRRNDDEIALADLENLDSSDSIGGGIIFRPLRQSANMKTSQAKKKFLFEAFPSGKLTNDFHRFVDEVLSEINKRSLRADTNLLAQKPMSNAHEAVL